MCLIFFFFNAQSRAKEKKKVKFVLDRTQSVVPPHFQETIHLRGTLVPGQPPGAQDGFSPPTPEGTDSGAHIFISLSK